MRPRDLYMDTLRARIAELEDFIVENDERHFEQIGELVQAVRAYVVSAEASVWERNHVQGDYLEHFETLLKVLETFEPTPRQATENTGENGQ